MFRVQVLLFWMTKKSVVVLLLNLKEDANASLVMFVIVMILRQFACDLETLLMLMYCNLWCSCVCNDILRCWLILVWMISVSKLRQSIHWINVFEHLLIFWPTEILQQNILSKTKVLRTLRENAVKTSVSTKTSEDDDREETNRNLPFHAKKNMNPVQSQIITKKK